MFSTGKCIFCFPEFLEFLRTEMDGREKGMYKGSRFGAWSVGRIQARLGGFER